MRRGQKTGAALPVDISEQCSVSVADRICLAPMVPPSGVQLLPLPSRLPCLSAFFKASSMIGLAFTHTVWVRGGIGVRKFPMHAVYLVTSRVLANDRVSP